MRGTRIDRKIGMALPMKYAWILLMAFCLIGGITGCSEGDDELKAPTEKPEEEVKKPELVVKGELDRVVPTAGKTVAIEFKATERWTAQSNQSWCTLSAQGGSAGEKVVVNATLSASEEPDQRMAVVTLQMGKLSQQVKITQMQKNALIVAKNEYVVPDSASVLELEVQANVSYTVKTGDTWLQQVQKSRGMEKKILKFQLEANPTYDARETTITVEGGELKQTVKVVQAQKDAIVAAKSVYEVDASEQMLEFKISANVAFSVSCKQDWIVKEQAARGLVDHPQRFRIQANKHTVVREGTIVFTAGKLRQEVKVMQEAAVAEPGIIVAGDLERVVPTAGKTMLVEFTSSEYWTAKSDQSWCRPMVTSGEPGKVKLEVVLDANGDYDNREAVLTLKGGTYEQQVKMIQMQKDALIVAKKEYVVKDGAGELALEVQSNVNFEVKVDASWMRQADNKRGLETKVLNFSIDENPTYDAREATITVESGKLKQIVKVVQAQKDAIVAAKSVYEVNASEQVLEFKISANVEFSVSSPQEWILQEQTTRGLVEYNQRFRILENKQTVKREGTLLYVANGLRQEIKVVQAAAEEKPAPEPIPVFRMVVKFEGYTFHVPTFTGTDVLGVIRWGDGKEEAYRNNLKHTFANDNLHEVTLEMKQANEVEVNSLKGISHLSFVETTEQPREERKP